MILHVIALMKLHTLITPENSFLARKVNPNPNLEGMGGAKTKKETKDKQTNKQTKQKKLYWTDRWHF